MRARSPRGASRAASLAFLATMAVAGNALADKVAVLPLAATSSLTKPELDQARAWTQQAVVTAGHTAPTPSELLSGEMAVKDGVADTSAEYRAVGRASGSAWTISGHVERIEVASSTAADGHEEQGFTLYRVELEACQVDTGRVESLSREIDPESAAAEIAPMIALLVRPEGIANAELPWEKGPRKKKPKPKPAAPPAPPPPPPPPPAPAAPPPPVRAYGEGKPIALGVLVGASDALARPSGARGPSLAMPVGGFVGYALEAVPGLELRVLALGHAIGPRAFEASGGARWAFGIARSPRLFVGPELGAGVHVALAGGRDARFLARGAGFLAWAATEVVQLEIAGDLAAALGGSGTLLLGGGSARAVVRF